MARRRRLTSFDYLSFSDVPDFIINSFFDKCTYKNRLLTSTFAYLNGLTFEQLLTLLHWKYFTSKDIDKMKSLYFIYFQQEQYRKKYFSFSVINKQVMFLDGSIRRYGIKIHT